MNNTLAKILGIRVGRMMGLMLLFALALFLLLPGAVAGVALDIVPITDLLICPLGCECMTEAEVIAKFGAGNYIQCNDLVCGTQQAPSTILTMVPPPIKKYCYRAKPAPIDCPEGCVCLTEAEAKRLGYVLCNNERILCGYDSQQNPLYCYQVTEPVCPPGCVCLTEAEAKARYGEGGYALCSDQICGTAQVATAAAVLTVNKYCFKQIEEPEPICPPGCLCLTEAEAKAKFGEGKYVLCADMVCGTGFSSSLAAVIPVNKYCYKAILEPIECPEGCVCLTEADAKAKFGEGKYTRCNNLVCGQTVPVAGTAAVNMYCFKPIAGPLCPVGCVALTAEEGKKLGYVLCDDPPVIVGYDKDKQPLYCFKKPGELCPPKCKCLGKEVAEELGLKLCEGKEIVCGKDATGAPLYCFEIPEGQCPPGCVCLTKEEAAKLGMTVEKDGCVDADGQYIRCETINAATGEYKYCFKREGAVRPNLIAFPVGLKNYTVDGRKINIDTPTSIYNDRTYVPIRFLAYAIGVSDLGIFWDPVFQKVTLIHGTTRVELYVGQKIIIVNGVETAIDVAPINVGSRVLLPARYVAEAFGFKVGWDALLRVVTLN